MNSDENKVIVHGTPGEGARAIGVIKGLAPLLVSIFLFGLFSGIILPMAAGGVVVCGFAVIFLVMLWLAYHSCSRMESYFKGARGEEIVAVWLASLPHDYHVFHDVEFAGSRGTPLDHLVVGPGGIFVIETKFWSGRVTSDGGSLLVDGIEPSRSPVNQVMAEVKVLKAFFAVKMSEVPLVTAVVCFAGGTLELDRGQSFMLPGEVAVCNVKDLCSLITGGGAKLASSEIERFVKLMEY